MIKSPPPRMKPKLRYEMRAVLVNQETHWYDDPDEVVAFARWFFEGATARAGEIIDVFEKPWKWDPEYQGMLADKKAEKEERHARAIARATREANERNGE